MLLNPTKNSISSFIYFVFMYVFLKISSFFFLILLLPVLSLRQVSTAPPLVSFQLMLLESKHSFCSFFLAFWRGSRNDARKWDLIWESRVREQNDLDPLHLVWL